MTSRVSSHGEPGDPSHPAIPEEPRSGSGPASTTERSSGCASNPVRQSELVLGAWPGAVPCARLHAKAVLHEWRLADLVETVELVVSELVTNAVRASEELAAILPTLPTVQLWLSADHERVLIQVWDGSNRMPQKQEPDPAALGGRGLLLVEAISESCGTYRLEGGDGKIIWARVGPAHAVPTSETPRAKTGPK